MLTCSRLSCGRVAKCSTQLCLIQSCFTAPAEFDGMHFYFFADGCQGSLKVCKPPQRFVRRRAVGRKPLNKFKAVSLKSSA